MAGGSQPKKQEVTQSNAPWSGVQPYLTEMYKGAQTDVYKKPTQYYPDQTYADFTPEQTQALSDLYARGSAGSPLVDSAQGYNQDVLAGKYLNAGNPYMGAVSDSIGNSVQEQVGARFSGSGRRMGSPGEVQTFQRDMADQLAPYQFQQYGQERQAQQQAAAMAPTLASQDYIDLQQMLEAGNLQQQQNQLGITEAVNRFNYQQDEPYQRLTRYGSLLGMGSPYTSTTSVSKGGGASPGGFDYAGLGLQGLSAAGNAYTAFSDRRLKKDIARVGKLPNGLPVYAFRYVWDDEGERRVGVMSDEVRVIAPWAIRTFGGFDAVDYGAL